MKSLLKTKEMIAEIYDDSVALQRKRTLVFGGAASGSLLLGVALFVVWLLKNKVQRAKRKAELAGPWR